METNKNFAATCHLAATTRNHLTINNIQRKVAEWQQNKKIKNRNRIIFP